MNHDDPAGHAHAAHSLAALNNPFSRPVIDGPRDVLATAESIHRTELLQIVQAFHRLEVQPVPRLKPGPLAMLMLSQMPGSGKSHLLGRLWRVLNGRATVIFLRAHQDKHAFWRRILERLVQELECPEATDQRVLTSGGVTQLDNLARHLLADLMQRAIEQKLWQAPRPDAVDLVRRGEARAIASLRKKLSGLMQWLSMLVPIWKKQLAAAGLRLERDAVAWLKVLVCYTLHTHDDPQRGLALAWLQGNDLEPVEAQLLGLTASQCRIDLPGSERTLASLNESAFQCVKDLCALSAFFRPVVFAFDQTETYGQDPELAHAFGATLGRLQAECINQFTVVTGNEQPWQHKVSNHFEQADLDRFDPSLRVVIKGIDRAQATELVGVKLQSAGYPADAIRAFTAQPWLAELFASRVARPLPRAIEKAACLALEQWRTGAPPVEVTPVSMDATDSVATTQAPQDVHAVLAQAFDAQRKRLLAHPHQLNFDVGVLSWVLCEGLSRVPGLAVKAVLNPPKVRMNIRWQLEGQVVFWVLDTSTHGGHWQAVIKDYLRHATTEVQGHKVHGRVAWHSSLKTLGDGTRKQLEVAATHGLALLNLDDAQMADLYAAQALFADVCQGDLPQIQLPALLEFLGLKFQPWVHRMAGLPGATASAVTAATPRARTKEASPSAASGGIQHALPQQVQTPAVAERPPRSATIGGGDLYLTVSQLVCACARPGWLAQWQMGLQPSTRPQGGDGLPTHGARLHLVAQSFAQWATDPANAAAAMAIDSTAAMYDRLLALGGQALCQKLLRQGQGDAKNKAELHLRQLARHFLLSRQACAGFTGWGDVFLVQEHALRHVALASHEGRTVRVSGRLDSLRHALPHDVLLLDYKFMPAENQPKEALLQLAIYQRMLHQCHGMKANGQVVFLGHPIRSLSRGAGDLARLFDAHVQPVLTRLLSMPLGPSVTGAFDAGQPAPAPVPVHVPAPVQVPIRQVTLGKQRHHPESPVFLPLTDLARHSAVLGSTGSGKTTAALHLIEQSLAQGIPAVLLDRKGDLCRYAQPEAWSDPHWPPAPHMDAASRTALHQRLDIRVYTPGSIQGRGLRLPLAPAGLALLPASERDVAAQDSAAAFAAALGLTRATDESKKAVLVRVFQVLARRIEGRGIVLDDVLTLLTSNDPDLGNAIGVLDPKLCGKLAGQVETFRINSGSLMDERAEPMDWAQCFSRRADGRLPLTIVSTKFLGDDSSTLFWVAQFFLELLRYVSRHPSDRLQGLLMIDEADLYLPATKVPATKGPLESLLKRARSGGVGLLLCTQSPGDLDYRGRDNIRNWLLGYIREARALDKLGGLLADSRVNPEQLGKQKVGQFVFAAEGQATALNVPPNLVKTQQLSEPEILDVAKRQS